MTSDELLDTSTEVAYSLLESGAEIYRVEESVHRIFAAYGARNGYVFAIPTLLILSVENEEGRPLTEIRRLGSHGSDLCRVAACNDLCRRICRDKPAPQEILAALSRIRALPRYSLPLQVAATAAVGFGFTLLFGGSLADACCSLLCSAAVRLVLDRFGRLEVNSFFTTIVASFAAAALALLGVQVRLGANLDKIVIGTLLNLVPGVALTNVMRDIIAGDLIAGLTKLVEALLIATGIALGTGVALSLWRLLPGVIA